MAAENRQVKKIGHKQLLKRVITVQGKIFHYKQSTAIYPASDRRGIAPLERHHP
jgi:hypothetical protein|eukprot:SAG25_NODE_642_length_6224_cov_2.486041_1_plen_54_part_00